MANQTIYPYGTNGQLPSSIGIINDLTTGGSDKALSAEMGKRLKRLIDNAGVSFDVVDNRLCIMATGGASKTPAPTITAEIQTDGRALVTITAADSGIAITYSINGGETQNYSQPFYIDTVGTSTITAKAQADGELPSNTVTATVTTESAGSVTIEQDTEDDTQFTATASDPTATVVITIGQQSQTGTGTASLSVTKTDEIQNVTVMATASVTGKIAATTTEDFTVSRLENTKLQGTSTAAVASIFIGDTEYKASEKAANGMQIVNTDNGDNTYTWTLDFGQNEISTLINGTGSKNIFGDTEVNQAGHNILTIDKFPDCVTTLGKYSVRWLNAMTSMAILGSNVRSIGIGAFNKCSAEFIIDKDDFSIGNINNAGGSVPANVLWIRTNNKQGAAFAGCPKLSCVVMPNFTQTSGNGGNFSSCSALKYIELGNPISNNGVYSSEITALNQYFIQNSSNLEAVVLYESNPSKMTLTPTDGALFLNMGANVKFYVPDDAVNDYKNHANWGLIADRIYGLSDPSRPARPTRPDLLNSNS